MGEGICDKGLPYAHEAADEDVFLAADKTEAEEILEPVPIDGDRSVPVELLKGQVEVRRSSL